MTGIGNSDIDNWVLVVACKAFFCDLLGFPSWMLCQEGAGYTYVPPKRHVHRLCKKNNKTMNMLVALFIDGRSSTVQDKW